MIKLLAYFFYLIFFPIIFVYKRLKIQHFNSNLQREINKANYMHKITGKNYYVIQSGYNLTVGSRKQLREKNKRVNKKLKLPQQFEGRFGKRLNFDYRNAIIYTADGSNTAIIHTAMEETLKNNGWIVFKTGCSCNGRPKYWKNEKDPDYNIVTKFSGFQIRQKNIIVANGKPDQLTQKMIEHGILDVD